MINIFSYLKYKYNMYRAEKLKRQYENLINLRYIVNEIEKSNKKLGFKVREFNN